MAKIQLPSEISQLICRFLERKYQAFAVGEAVRLLYLGCAPQDYDIAVNADVERIRAALEGYRIVDDDNDGRDGVLVLVKGLTVMVTGYASDENGELDKSAALRDRAFTTDALFADENGEITDIYGALDCLETLPYTLDFIGTPTPLSIMEGLALEAEGEHRLSAKSAELAEKSASIVPTLEQSVLRGLFERVLMGKRAGDVLLLHKEIIFEIFPELRATDEYDTKSKLHIHTLYRHTCKAVELAVPNLSVRYALLFHGSGKPDCEGINGAYTFFFGHAERAAIYAKRAFSRLGTQEDTGNEAIFLINNHDLIDASSDFDPSDYAELFTPYELKLLMQFSAANIRSKDPRNEFFARDLRRRSDLL